jgi:aminoglycoside 6'-N-acetyltransferase I
MHIRRATPADFGAWALMRMALYTDVRRADNQAQMESLLADPSQDCLLAIGEAGEVVGFVELSERRWAEGCDTSPVGYVEGWFVAEGARGNGVGRRLMDAACDWSRARGYRELASDADETNAASVAAHKRLGFSEAERTVQFYRRL